MADQEDIKNHYNARANKSVRERKMTRNINIRNAHNFIKSCLINKYVRNGDSVLDLGFGKGGDLQKYRNAGVSVLYGLDIADRSILDAVERARSGNYPFKIVLKTRNTFGEPFDLGRAFDVVSVQFAFHYAFAEKRILETAIKNISNHLRYDGYFIFTTLDKNEILRRRDAGTLANSYYRLEFKESGSSSVYGNTYNYTLVDSLDSCVEYTVDMDELAKIMRASGFRLVECTPFRTFKTAEMAYNSKYYKAMCPRELNAEEQAVFDLHIAVAFQKVRRMPNE